MSGGPSIPTPDPFSGRGLFESARDYYQSPRFQNVWESWHDQNTAVQLLYFFSLRLDAAPMTHVLSWCDQAVERSTYLVGKYASRLDDCKRQHKNEVSSRRSAALVVLASASRPGDLPASRLPEISRSDVADYIETLPDMLPIIARESALKELVNLAEGLAEASKRRHASAVQVSVNERHEVDDAGR